MSITKVLAAPNYPVNFSACYMGDVLTSTFRVFIHFLFSSVYSCLLIVSWIANDSRVSSSLSTLWWDCNPVIKQILVPFMTVLPLWIRFMQCLRYVVQSGYRWPHFGNAFKYAITFVFLSIGILAIENKQNHCWVVGLTLVTLIQLSWDIFMDWGISFRRPLLLQYRCIYIAFIAINLILRFSWVISLNFDQQSREVECLNNDIPTKMARENVQNTFDRMDLVYFETCLCVLELIRRSLWGILRLEYEQINQFGHSSLLSNHSGISSHNIAQKMSIFASSLDVQLDEDPLDIGVAAACSRFVFLIFDEKYWMNGVSNVVITRTFHMITGLESIRFCNVLWISRFIEILVFCILLLIIFAFITSQWQ